MSEKTVITIDCALNISAGKEKVFENQHIVLDAGIKCEGTLIFKNCTIEPAPALNNDGSKNRVRAGGTRVDSMLRDYCIGMGIDSKLEMDGCEIIHPGKNFLSGWAITIKDTSFLLDAPYDAVINISGEAQFDGCSFVEETENLPETSAKNLIPLCNANVKKCTFKNVSGKIYVDTIAGCSFTGCGDVSCEQLSDSSFADCKNISVDGGYIRNCNFTHIAYLSATQADIDNSKFQKIKNESEDEGLIFIEDCKVTHCSFDDVELRKGVGVEPTYQNLGWIQLPDSGTGRFDLCYRASQLLGPQSAKYAGNFEVRPQGDFHSWRQMVEQDVIGHKVLELVLIASLAAVVHGLIAPYTNAGNPIVHLNYSSGKGKSTAAYLAASTAGKPFDGAVTVRNKLGTMEHKQSLYQSWGATDTALITSLAGNCGIVTVLNELGKNLSKNMTRLIFEFSEGTDKRRSNPKLESLVSESYVTVFISTGESSLLDKCKSKLEGLQVRVMEIDQPITDSAEHANRIKKVCTEHCGHAVPIRIEDGRIFE